MCNEKAIKIMPSVLFLFCLLEVFELVLVIIDMNKTERLETEIRNNLKVLEGIAALLSEHLEHIDLEHFKDKGN
ncbi:hypothetical protein FIM42_04450 [Helicobacter pylori]|uniref:hypothetical protein n=1 Tax=Helicobacter pylori TaxID=210 RepID=UPI00112CCA60|nr:hypothetical protein [Helicobacter pylori]TPH95673.1 hypothetical protein FIM42_04450 [Helicobacter pylori]